MKKLLLLLMAVLAYPMQMMAQEDIQISRFDRNYTSLIASMDPVYDNAGEACAVIRFFVRNKDFIIEPNLGVVKKEEKPGEIRLWVPRGTKRITVRYKNMMPLSGYEIPTAIESKVTYDAWLEISSSAIIRKRANLGHNVYVGAGYNALSIMGPSLSLGFDLNQHKIELGAVYGLEKTDDWYFYDTSGNISEAYNYQAIRVQLRYGYEIEATDFLSMIPQVGATYNILNGKAIGNTSGKGTSHKNANSISAFAAVRMIISLNETFKLQITPEYDFGVFKDKTCKLMADKDNKFKSWTDGFNLNMGLIIFF